MLVKVEDWFSKLALSIFLNKKLPQLVNNDYGNVIGKNLLPSKFQKTGLVVSTLPRFPATNIVIRATSFLLSKIIVKQIFFSNVAIIPGRLITSGLMVTRFTPTIGPTKSAGFGR